MELHKGWLAVDLIEQARKDILENSDKRSKGYEHQNRVWLEWVQTDAIKKIAEQCEAIAWHTWRPAKSGAQIHEPGSKPDSAQNWHQDIVALGGTAGTTVWVPLDPIDGTRPSLMFGNNKHGALRHYYNDKSFSEAFPMPEVDLATVVLKMDLGDVLSFDWSDLHCTYWTSDMTNGRISLDLRYAPEDMNAESKPREYDGP